MGTGISEGINKDIKIKFDHGRLDNMQSAAKRALP